MSNKTANNLDPNIDPSKGVKRLNKLPLIITIGIVAAVFIIMVLGVASRNNKQKVAEEEENEAIMDDESVALLTSEIPSSDIGSNKYEPEVVYKDSPTKGKEEETTKTAQAPSINPELLKRLQALEEANKKQSEEIRKMKEQEMKEVVDAPALVKLDDFRQKYKTSASVATTPVTPPNRVQYAAPPVYDGSASAALLPPLANTDEDILGLEKLSQGDLEKTRAAFNAFRKRREDDEFILPYKVQDPVTELEIKSGSVINATMITGINSDLPGNIIAQVNQNVFDTATGEHLLIPQGTKLFGKYNDNNTYGVDRVGIVWNRIIFPNGQSLSVGDLAGSDVEGFSGLKDKVNHHYLRMFGSAVLLSGASVGVAVTGNNDDDDESASQTAREEVAVNLGRVINQKLEKDMNIEPTIKIRQGMKLAVLVARDMTFEKSYKQHINYAKLGHPTQPKKKVFDPREGKLPSKAKQPIKIHNGK